MARYDWRLHWVSLSILFAAAVAVAGGAGPRRPTALMVAVSKDAAGGQYVAHLRQRTPLVPVLAVVDLAGSFFWVDCDGGFVSSSSRRVQCRSAQCTAARSGVCINHTTCGFLPTNPFTRTSSVGELAEDLLVASSANGSRPGPPAAATRALFGCATTGLLEGLVKGAEGIAGLGRSPVALPSQLAAKFSLRRSFAVCLSDTVGGVFFGGGPYLLVSTLDAASFLTNTPLLVNPSSSEYFIGVTGILVNEKPVTGFNAAFLTINKETGRGGTRISTAEPYTVLERSIFRALAAAFAGEAELRPVPPVEPFGFCFNSSGVPCCTRLGPVVPKIDLLLQNERVVWRVWGGSSVVEVGGGISCLAVVDGGPDVTSAIVIGGYQLEDNLLEFDLATSRLGFSGYLPFYRFACMSFNFSAALP